MGSGFEALPGWKETLVQQRVHTCFGGGLKGISFFADLWQRFKVIICLLAAF
jgi:hypothetical protein